MATVGKDRYKFSKISRVDMEEKIKQLQEMIPDGDLDLLKIIVVIISHEMSGLRYQMKNIEDECRGTVSKTYVHEIMHANLVKLYNRCQDTLKLCISAENKKI